MNNISSSHLHKTILLVETDADLGYSLLNFPKYCEIIADQDLSRIKRIMQTQQVDIIMISASTTQPKCAVLLSQLRQSLPTQTTCPLLIVSDLTHPISGSIGKDFWPGKMSIIHTLTTKTQLQHILEELWK